MLIRYNDIDYDVVNQTEPRLITHGFGGWVAAEYDLIEIL